MHVVHLRSTIIGDALARLLRFLGHKVIADNHLGDWGTQFGMILWGWKNHRDEDAYGRDPVGELARLYRLAATRIKPYEQLSEIRELEAKGRRAKAAEELKELLASSRMTLEELECRAEEGRPVAEASREETARLHAGDPENRALWRQFIPHCLGALRAIYERLEVHFDQWLGESAYDAMLPEVVADLRNKGLAEESDGALVVPVESVAVPFMVQKRDGAFNYGTSDLATIKYRKEHFNPDVMLYVVDHRQGDHFKALFEVADRWGYGGIVMEHVGFGTIMGQDKRPYKTREGDVVGLESLLDEAVYKALEVVNENSPELDLLQRRQVAEIVGIGAVKYADLSQNRTSDYVYDENKMLAMQGNTATYMQYAYARNRSIFSKANEDVAPYRTNPPLPILDTAHERALGMQLLRLHEALEAAAAEYKPNLITAYLWDLAKTYSGFFENCPVIRAETPELRRSRLLLCDLTARALRLCLTLLGIRTVERM
jgi:arginyl-tRNA synthetase